MTARPHRPARRPVLRSREILSPVLAPALLRRGLLATTALLPLALLLPAGAQAQAPNAAPTGGQVTAGSATISQGTTTTRIDQATNRAVIDWQRFDVGRNQTVQFNQPSAQSWTLNRVNTPDPSLIAGQIQANGGVAIVNQSGVVFTPGAQVNVGSLIVSAAGITNQNFMAGRMVFDQAARPGARVENHGNITVAERGLASLVAPGVANSGVIQARLGRVALAGAETFTLDLAGDGLVSLDVTQSVRQAPEGGVALVTNSGTIAAPGGSVLLTADAARGVVDTLLRNTGRISADAEPGTAAGQVALRGGRNGDVEVAAGTVSASGSAAGVAGGTVSATSDGGAVRVGAAARLDASGAGGGTVRVGDAATARSTVEGEAAARGTGARVRGGLVTVEAKESVEILAGAKLDASGTGGGGTVLAGTTGVGRNQTMAERTVVAAGAELNADATEAGDGGTIAVNATSSTDSQGLLSARGGPQGGDGGFIEVSTQGAELLLAGEIRLEAPAGNGGTLLIDPNRINIVAGDGNLPDSGVIAFADGSGTISVKVGSINSFTAGTNILLQANNRIDVDAAVNRTTAGSLFLETGSSGQINVEANMTVQNGALGFRTGTLTIDNATVSASTNVTVTANTILMQNGVTLVAPIISLRANTFTLTGSNTLTGSTLVELGPRTSTTAPFIPANSVSITTALLRLGQTRSGDRSFGTTADTPEVTADSLTLTSAITRPGTNLELYATDMVKLQAPIDLGSGPTGGGLALRATAPDSQVLQEAGATVTARQIGGQAGSAGFTLAESTNTLGSVGIIDTTGNVTLRTLGDLSIQGAVSGGDDGVVRVSAAGELSISASGSVSAGDPGDTGEVHLWGSSIALGGPVTGSVVTLAASSDPDTYVAGGAVTQSGDGTVSAGTLSVLAGGDVTLALDGNSIAAVAVEVTGTGDVAIRSSQAMTVTDTPADVPHPDGSGPTTPAAGISTTGDIRLAAPELTIDAPLVAAGNASARITLIANILSFGADGLLQPGALATPGTVTITRLTDGAIDLGGAGGIAGALEITSTELGKIDFASRLRIGGGFDAATLAPSGAGGSTLTVTAPIDTSTLGIGVVGIDTLDLRGSTVSQEAGATVTTARLESTSGAGGLQLAEAGNDIAAIGDVTAGGDSTIRVDAGIVLDGAIALGSNTLNLRTDGTVTQPSGTVTGGLDIAGATGGASGAVTLGQENALTALAADSSGNVSIRTEGTGAFSIGDVTAAGNIRIFSNNAGTGAISVDGAVESSTAGIVRIETRAALSVAATGSVTSGSLAGADAGAVHLWGRSIALAGAVQAGSQVSLAARGGAIDASAGGATPATITQSGAGLVTTRRLALAAVGDVTLGLDNQVDAVSGTAGGSITLRSLRDLAVAVALSIPRADNLGSIGTGSGLSSATGSISLTAPTLTLTGAAVSATAANQTITLTGDSIDLGATGVVSADTSSGTVVMQPFSNATDLLVNAASGLGLVSANTLSLRSLGNGGTPVAGAVELAGNLDLSNVNVLDLQGASVRQAAGSTLKVGTLTGTATGGDFDVSQTGNRIGTLGPLSAAAPTGPSAETGTVWISSDTLTVGGTVTAAGAVNLNAETGSLDINAAVTANGGDVTLNALLGSIQIDAAVTASGGIALDAGTGIAQGAPGVLSANGGAGAVSADTTLGAVALAVANNQAGAISGSAGADFAFRSTTALTANAVTAGGAVDITGAGLSVTGPIDASSDVALTASSGNLVVNGDVTATTGSATLTATTGNVQILAGVTAGTDITLSGRTGISQDAAGILTADGGAGALSATAIAGAVALTAADNSVGSVSGAASSAFAFRSVSGLTVGSVSGGSGVAITGPLLTVDGPVSAITGNIALTATTGDIAIDGTVTATAGNVILDADNGAIQIDAAVGGVGISLSAQDDIGQTALGVLTADTLSATSTAGAVNLAAADNSVGAVSGAADDAFAFRSVAGLTVGSVSGGSGVAITGPSLTVDGPVDAATGNIALTATTGDIDIDGAVTAAAGDVTLSAQDDIGQTASGVLTADALSATSAAGAVTLTAADNAVGSVTGSAADGFAFRSTQDLDAGPITASSGNVLLVAPTLSVTGLVQAQANGAGVTLVADALTLGANTISAGSVATPGQVTITRLSSGGTLAIGGANAAGVTAVDGDGILRAGTLLVGGAFDSGTMMVSGNGDHAVTLSGAIDLTGRAAALALRGTSIDQTGGALTVGGLTATATSGDIALEQAGNAIATLGAIIANSGAARIVSSSALTVNGPVSARDAIALTGATLDIAGTLEVTAGDLSLTATGGDLTIGTAIEALAGNVNLAATSGSLQIDAAVTAGLDIDLAAGVAIRQGAAGVLSANGGTGALIANATTGAVSLASAGNQVGSLSGSAGGDFAFGSTTGLTVGAVTAGGGVAITGPGLTIAGPLAANGGDAVLIAVSGDIAVNGSVSAADAVQLIANSGAIQIDAGVTAGSGITLSAQDDVAQGAGGTLIADAGTGALSATSTAGQVALVAASNRIGAVSGAADGDFALRSVTALTANAVTAGGALTLSGAALTVSGPLAANGGDVRLTALTANLRVNGTVTASADIRLSADNNISQGAGGVLTANGGSGLVAANATTGDVTLTAADNQAGTVRGTAGGDFAFRSVTGLTVSTVAAGGGVGITGPSLTIASAVTADTGDIALTTTSTATTPGAGDLTVNDAVTATAGDIALTARAQLSLQAPVTAGGDIAIRAPAVRQTAAGVLSANGGLGTLDASGGFNDIFLDAADNRVGVLTGGSGQAFRFRGVTPLTVGDVEAFYTLSITAPSITVSGQARGGDALLTAETGGLLVTGQVQAMGSGGIVRLTAVLGSIELRGAVSSPDSIDLSARGSITQNSTGQLEAQSVSANAQLGDVSLTAADNRITIGMQGTAGGDFAFRSVEGLFVSTVTAGGAVDITGPSITVDNDVTARGGDIRLTALSGDIAVHSGLDASGDVVLDAGAGGISNGVFGTVQAGGSANLTALNDIVLDGTVTANAGGVGVTSTAGGITTSAAITGATGVDLTALNDIVLNGTVTANTAGVDITSANGGIATSAAITGQTSVGLTALNDIVLDGTVTANAGGVDITSTSGGISTSAAITGETSVGFSALNGIVLNGTVTANTAGVDIASTSGGISTSAAITGETSVGFSAPGDIVLDGTVTANAGGVNIASTGGGITPTAAITGASSVGLTAPGDIVLDGTVTATAGGVDITSTSGGITTTAAITGQTSVGLTALNGIVLNGTVTANTAGVNIASTAGGITTAAAITGQTSVGLTAPGDIVLNGTVTANTAGVAATSTGGGIAIGAALGAGSDVTLLANTSITQAAAGLITANAGAGLLTANATTGAVALGTADNVVGRLTGSAAAGFAFRNATALTIGSITTSGSGIAIETLAGPMVLNGPLNSAAGIDIASGGSLTLPGTSITARGGDATLRSAGDLTASNVTASSPGTLTLAAEGAGAMLRLEGGSYTADYIVLSAGPAGDGTAIASFSDVDFSLRTAMLIAAGGGIGRDGDLVSTVVPLETGALPLIFFDTRRTATALRGLDPAVFSPATRDLPTRQPNDQLWQVFNPRRGLPPNARIVGVADGTGAATSAAAGDIVVNLEAPEQPVFFLLDGGTAIGTIVAGRLGVHGQPSSQRLPGDLVVDLSGKLAGIDGSAAARFGRVATTNPADQGRYRFENCVLDTINCVVPSLAQPVVLPLSNRIDIRSDAPRLDPDVLLPNIAEEDY